MSEQSAWSYDPDNLATSTRDQVRFLLGDTDPEEPLLSDAEVDYLVSTEGVAQQAAAIGAERLAARYARETSRSMGSLSISADQKSRHFRELAEQLRQELATRAGAPWAAITTTRKDALEDDTSLVDKNFRIGMFDDPAATTPTDPRLSSE